MKVISKRYLTALMLVLLLTGTAAAVLFTTQRGQPRSNSVEDAELVAVAPEHMRTMEEVVLSLAYQNTTLEHHEPILEKLPDYSEIMMLVPAQNTEVIRRALENKPYANRVRLRSYNPDQAKGGSILLLFPEEDKLKRISGSSGSEMHCQGTIWAQDLFEPGVNHFGQPILLVPEIYKYYYESGDDSVRGDDVHVMRDNAFVVNLDSLTINTRVLPLVFKGGNVTADHLNGEHIIFCGSDILKTTRTIIKATAGAEPTETQIRAAIRSHFKADKVIILGNNDPQPNLLYHIDQAMVLLQNAVAGVERIIDLDDASPARRQQLAPVINFLSLTRATLASLGYEILDIEVSSDNVLKCQHYANSIPFINKHTGRKSILMPVYSASSSLDRDIIKRNTRTLESAGYEVIPVETSLDQFRGGIHCLVNVVQ